MKSMMFILLSILSLLAPVYAQDTMENVYIDDVLNDGDSLWLATNKGLAKYSKLTGETTFYAQEELIDAYIFGYPAPDNYKKIQVLSGRLCLAKDAEGNIWMIAGGGLVKFNGVKSVLYMQYPTDDSMYWYYPVGHAQFILIDEEDNKWLGGMGTLFKFDGTGFQQWHLPGRELATSPRCGLLDRQGNIWVGSFARTTGALNMFDGVNIIAYDNIIEDSYTFYPRALRREVVNAVESDKAGNVWVATYYIGLAKHNGDETFTYYHSGNSACPVSTVLEMKFDEAGNLWFIGDKGNFDCCLVKYDGTNFESWDFPVRPRDEVSYIYGYAPRMEIDSQGTIWIGTQSHGLIKFSNGEFTQIDIRKLGGGSSIDTVINDGEPVAVYYYNLQGLAVSQPSKGQVYIAKEIYESGAVKIKKIMK